MLKTNSINCSFCKKSHEKADCIIRGHAGYICNNCVDVCREMIEESNLQAQTSGYAKQLPNFYPKEIYDLISKEVIGQDSAKRALSVAAFMHLQRIKEQVGEKSNILLAGPTGSGKTLMVKTLAKIVKLPVAIIDATTLTEVGYVGEDPADAIANKLYSAANKDIGLAESGIVYIDEIDKLAKCDTVHVSRAGVQRSLLTILEDSVLTISQKSGLKQGNSEPISLRTQNILFICSGAFVGIEKIAYRNRHGSKMGFGKTGEKEISSKDLTHQDFVTYGLMEELVARLPIIAKVSSLSSEELEHMMHFSESSPLKKYSKILSRLEIDLKITKQATKTIAEKAIQLGTGARAVKTQLESIITGAIFEINKNKNKGGVLQIDEKTANGEEEAKITLHQKK